jgi:mannose-6-phosphate isomerase-like protein (cupin superfamily)
MDDPVDIRQIEGLGRETRLEDGGFKVIRYTSPTDMNRDRAYVTLARSDILFSAVQVYRKSGGEPQLHSHAAMDGFWFVLKGRVRFYGEGDEPVADLGEHEGIFVPRNAKYWFEVGDCEQLELLQVEALDKTVPNTMQVYGPRKQSAGPIEVWTADGRRISDNVIAEPG